MMNFSVRPLCLTLLAKEIKGTSGLKYFTKSLSWLDLSTYLAKDFWSLWANVIHFATNFGVLPLLMEWFFFIVGAYNLMDLKETC